MVMAVKASKKRPAPVWRWARKTSNNQLLCQGNLDAVAGIVQVVHLNRMPLADAPRSLCGHRAPCAFLPPKSVG
jgi:hypothetical protein